MSIINKESFCWHSFDIVTQLNHKFGHGWSNEIIEFARRELKNTPIIPRSSTSREADRDSVILTAVVDGIKIKSNIPWLHKLYRTDFLALAKKASGINLSCASNDLYGINLNIQLGTDMRYECHVDSNPIQGMFYVTSHTVTSGGVLCVANKHNARSTEEVDSDCSIIEPKTGSLVFFDARQNSHYVSSLSNKGDIRVAAAMNFYSSESPETKRPKDLSKHLGLV